MSPVLLVESPLIAAWVGVAALEIASPATAIRWRRRWLARRTRGRLRDAIASEFDSITGEQGDDSPWESRSVRRRVQLLGLLNLAMAVVAGFVIVALTR